jgi:hypothetical protein
VEVACERRARLDRDDHAGVPPDALEERGEQLAPFGGRRLDVPETGEVGEDGGGLFELWICWGSRPFEFLFERLAARGVLRSGEVAHHVEVLEALELGGQVATALAVGVGVRRFADRVDHERAELLVGGEVAQPVDQLRFERFGLEDRRAAGVSVAPR